MNWPMPKKSALMLVLVGVAISAWLFLNPQPSHTNAPQPTTATQALPVEMAQIERGPMELRRTFSGALEALAQFVVAPKVDGRIKRLIVNLADTVDRGQVVAELDNDEYVQAVAQIRAELAGAKANLAEVKNLPARSTKSSRSLIIA